jgi:hypothetical protein
VLKDRSSSSPYLTVLSLSFIPVCAADANILINTCRMIAQRYFFAYQEPMPVEQLVRSLCDTKQVRHYQSIKASNSIICMNSSGFNH